MREPPLPGLQLWPSPHHQDECVCVWGGHQFPPRRSCPSSLTVWRTTLAPQAQYHIQEGDLLPFPPESPATICNHVSSRQGAEPCAPLKRNGYIRPQPEPITPCGGQAAVVGDVPLNHSFSLSKKRRYMPGLS